MVLHGVARLADHMLSACSPIDTVIFGVRNRVPLIAQVARLKVTMGTQALSLAPSRDRNNLFAGFHKIH